MKIVKTVALRPSASEMVRITLDEKAGARRSDDETERAATVKLVDDLRALVHLGRTAAAAKNRPQMTEVSVRLGTLVAEATAGGGSSSARSPARTEAV